MTRGLAEDGVLRKERVEFDDPRQRKPWGGKPPYELTVDILARIAIEEHLTDRLGLWGLDAADLFTTEEVRAAFFR